MQIIVKPEAVRWSVNYQQDSLNNGKDATQPDFRSETIWNSICNNLPYNREETNFLPKSHYSWGTVGYLNAFHDFVFCEDSNFLQSEKQRRN